jgi:hypoxanthine phosphoribosyltransferase
MTEYKYYSLDKIWSMIYRLGKIVKGFNPAVLIGMSRGGLCVVRVLSDFLDNPNVFIIRTRYYKGIESTERKLEIPQDVEEELLRNKKVLIVDDVADTGTSISAVLNLIKKKGASETKTATLHYKPWSKVKPDYFIEETEKWIIYPWEIHETIESIIKNTPKEKLTKELAKTGIPKEIYKQFL